MNTRFILQNAWSPPYQNPNKSSILWKQCRITRIRWCLNSCNGNRSVHANKTQPFNGNRNFFLIEKCNVAPIKQATVPKLELEAAVIGVRLHSTIVKQSFFAIDKSVFWTVSQVVLDWILLSEKQPLYVANGIREMAATTKAKQWRHICTLNNTANHGTIGLDPCKISLKWLQHPEFLRSAKPINNQPVPSKPADAATKAHIASNNPEPIVNPARFPSWTKMLLTLATVFNLLFRASKNCGNKQHYATTYLDLSWKHQTRSSQENWFLSTVCSLKKRLKPQP